MMYTKEICRVCILKTLAAKIIFILSLLLIAQHSFAQFSDHFSDGDFTTNPKWVGTESKFIVSASQLKLQAPAVADQAYLSTTSHAINDASWEFLVKLEFNPSSSNYIQVYLASDSSNVSGPLNGYFVMLGNTADEVSLYRQTGTTRIKIIDGVDGRLNLSTSATKVKVTRDALGNWQLFSDVGTTGTYASEGIALDTTHLSSTYFGLFYKYTATRSDKFYVDDIVVTGNPIVDSTPPTITSLHVISSTEIDVVFSEKVEKVTAEVISNYSASNGLGNPAIAVLQSDGKIIRLSFAQDFPNGVECSITISTVKDLAGNEMAIVTKPFLYFENFPVSFKDVIITEIFADPSPQLKLPDAEYIEVFNRSEHAIDLTHWVFTDGSSEAVFPSTILLPKAYVILTSSASASDYSGYENVFSLSNFPTLNNDGDVLVIRNSSGLLIDSVKYTDNWYLDDDKKEGGWSLELIDPENSCGEKENWTASEDDRGGSPGAQNSVLASKPDLIGPKLLSAIPVSSTVLRVVFNERLETKTPLASSFQISPEQTILAVTFTDASLTKIDLELQPSLQSETIYTIVVHNVRDCNLNIISSELNSLQFGLPEQAEPGDIVINEVLFNPRPTGIDFVEVVNTSAKFFNLKDWSLSNIEDDILSNTKIITTEDFLVLPNSYILFTENGNVLKGEYVNAHEETFLEVPLPSLNDDGGSIAMADGEGLLIDRLQYSKGWHSVFIKEDEGVSLERVSLVDSTQAPQNWKSASSIVGFATPGYINSNAREQTIDADAVSVDPVAFIPISGQPDFTQIKFQFDQGGYVANLKIFDSQGNLIKQIANNEVLGTEGFFRWDGDGENGDKARAGYYMVWFEVFNSNGEIMVFRKPVVIAMK